MALFIIIKLVIISFSGAFGLNQTYNCTNVGNQPVFYDPNCSTGQSLGCNAGGLGQNCRFCGFSNFVSCPSTTTSTNSTNTLNTNTNNIQMYICPNVGNQPVFYDPSCSTGQSLGCNAGGFGQNCRFCGFSNFVSCSSTTTSTTLTTTSSKLTTTTSATSTTVKTTTTTTTSKTVKTTTTTTTTSTTVKTTTTTTISTTVKTATTTTTSTTVKTTATTTTTTSTTVKTATTKTTTSTTVKTTTTTTTTSTTVKTTTTTTTSTTVKTTTSSNNINWGGNNWAMACDFLDHDLSNFPTIGSQCGPLCAKTFRCTHFTWNNYNGGTCWMKYGNVLKTDAFFTNDYSMVCGVNPASLIQSLSLSKYKFLN